MDGARDPPQPGPGPRRAASVPPGGEPQALLARALAPLRSFQTGRQLGFGYALGPRISAGAQGDVFAARVDDTGEAVAIKRVRVLNATSQRHVQQELAAVMRADAGRARGSGAGWPGHPCIVAYRDWFAGPAGLERDICIVMERCDFSISDMVFGVGQLRGQYERKCKAPPPDPQLYRFTERELVKVMYQMLSALDFLNQHGIVHRDLKTDNILWLAGQPAGFYKLADFGTAVCQTGSEPAKRVDECGTLWTMAPELLGRRPHGPNCDVWSLGVALLEMGLLDKPFTSKELLAYRNMFESSLEGSFWPVMLQKAGVVPPGPGGVPKMSHAQAPRSMRGRASSGTVAPRGIERSVSPPLPGVQGTRSPTSCPHPSSPSGGRRRAKLGSLPPLQPLQLQRPPSTPPSPASPPDSPSGGLPPSPAGAQAAEALRAKKQTFLRRRCGSRWCYGGGFASVVLDLLLEEDTALRAPAASLLAMEQVGGLLAAHGVGEGAPSAPVADHALAAASEADGGLAPESTGNAIESLLMHVTGESFHKAMSVERLKQRAAAERAEQRPASSATESAAEPPG